MARGRSSLFAVPASSFEDVAEPTGVVVFSRLEEAVGARLFAIFVLKEDIKILVFLNKIFDKLFMDAGYTTLQQC